MGQYYYPTILRQKGKRFYSEQYYSWDFNNGLKLMEHSYIGNEFVKAVISQLFNRPGRLAWMGDYHEAGDITHADLDKAFRTHYAKYHTREESTDKPFSKPTGSTKTGRFILNHDRHEYIDMRVYSDKAPADSWGCKIHPLPLLTAVGNGRGGGDYWGVDQDRVGSWAGDLIETQDAKPNGYLDITDLIEFKESY